MQWGVIFWVLSIIKSQKMYSMVTFSLDDMIKYQDNVPVMILHELHWTSLHTVHLCGFWSEWQILQYNVLFRGIWFQFCPTCYQSIPCLIDGQSSLQKRQFSKRHSIVALSCYCYQASLTFLFLEVIDLSFWEQYFLFCSYYGSITGLRNKAQTVHCSWFQGLLFTRVLLFP